MRRLLLTLAIAGIALAVPQSAQAGMGGYLKRMTLKTVFGFVDVFYAPVELIIAPMTHGIDFHRNDAPAVLGAGLGVPVGFAKGQIRFYRGVGDIITFPMVSERPRKWEWTIGGSQLPLTATAYDDDPAYLGEDALPNR